MPLVTRIRIVKPAKGYWFNFDKYRVAPFHRHSPRFIRLILAFFFFFIFFIFISFFFFYTIPIFAIGIGIELRREDVARVGFKLCTRLRVIAARNWICFAWNRIDWLIEDWCRKSVPFWDVSRWYKIDIFQIKKFVTRKHSWKSWLYSISFRNLRIKYYHVRIVRDKNFS